MPLGAQTAPVSSPVPGFTIKGSVEIQRDFSGNPVGRWSGGALVVVEKARSAGPVVIEFGREGNPLSQFTLAIPGAELTNVYSGLFSRGFDGALAIGGSTYSADGRSATFLAWVSPDHRETIVTRISSFVPCAVALASDGTIWTAGWERREGKGGGPNHHIIRRFDRSGKVLSSSVPYSSLKINESGLHPAVYSHLAASKDRIGWWSDPASTYIEFSLDGVEVNRFAVSRPDSAARWGPGFALCDDGGVFRSFTRHDEKGVTSWGISALDRPRGIWKAIPGEGKWGMLYGCDGPLLAVRTGERNLVWIEPVKPR